MQSLNTTVLLTLIFASLQLQAQSFEIIDGSANVAGGPSLSSSQAHDNWAAACEKWKAETKDLNKNNEVMMVSCEVPTCSSNLGEITCASVAVFKVKTSGTYAAQSGPPPTTMVQPIVEETVVQTAPPPVIIETVPAPRPGFIWITGYWGWRSSHHYWIGGHWEHGRPGYVYVGPRWRSHGRAWRLEGGHWRR